MIVATCPHCNQQIEAENSFAGTSANCPSCDGEITIPSIINETEKSIKNKMKLNKNTIISLIALSFSLIAILMQLGVFPRSNLDFETPEKAIKSSAEVIQSGSFNDLRRMRTLLQDNEDWEFTPPKSIKIEKTLEVKDTGDADYDGGALCFLKYKKKDGVETHKVVFLSKNKKGLFEPSFLGGSVKSEYSNMITNWEKNGTLK